MRSIKEIEKDLLEYNSQGEPHTDLGMDVFNSGFAGLEAELREAKKYHNVKEESKLPALVNEDDLVNEEDGLRIMGEIKMELEEKKEEKKEGLSLDEKILLKEIMNDKYSVGAFTGMIFNAYRQRTNDTITIQGLIKEALMVRLAAMELTK